MEQQITRIYDDDIHSTLQTSGATNYRSASLSDTMIVYSGLKKGLWIQ